MEEMIKRNSYLLNKSLKGKKEYNLRYLLTKKDKNDGRTDK